MNPFGHMSKGYSRSIRRPIGVPGASWAVVDQRKRPWTVPELWKTQTARFPQARWTARRTRRPQRPTGPLAFTNDGPRRKMTRRFTTGRPRNLRRGRYVNLHLSRPLLVMAGFQVSINGRF